MISQSEMKNILRSVNPPEYIIHHMNRIVSCVDHLQNSLQINALETLDLGHDSHVGILLSKCGAKLCGNVPPPELVGVIAPPEQKDSFILPDGEQLQWQLSAFNFQEEFPFANESFDLVTAFEVIEHVTDNPRAFVKEVYRVIKKMVISTLEHQIFVVHQKY